jgi:NAD(P)-dependent dehydrogenase (short-subunit alcohol dehydrogenase family)
MTELYVLDSLVQEASPKVAAMTRRLNKKTALVTGATSNIGRAIAERFAREGARVILSGRDADRGAQAVDAIRSAGGRAEFIAGALSGDPEESRWLAARTLDLTGGELDILVNNAGVYPRHSTETADADLFDTVFGVNVKAPFLLTQALIPHLIEHGGGSVINLGSWITTRAVPSSPLYSASKGAIETLTRAWAAEFGQRGVRVNAISPGVIRPPHLEDHEFPGTALMVGSPAGVAGAPEAIAAAAVYLASDESDFVHGSILDVDGGRANVHVSA